MPSQRWRALRYRLRLRIKRVRAWCHKWWIRLMWVGVVAVVAGSIVLAVSVVAPGVVGFSLADPAPDGAANTAANETVNHGYNLRETEQLFLGMLNDERESRGLQPVAQRDALTEMGRAHSSNMAKHDYLGHEEPDGTTIEGRYRSRGLLPKCRLPTGGGSYYPGAENAAHYWVDETMDTSKGDLYVANERDLAQGLFRSWMSSPPHRRAMLIASADQAGLGIYIDEKGKVYASLELC